MGIKTMIVNPASSSEETGSHSLLYSRKWGYIASVALLPYAVLKTLWAFGITFGVTNQFITELNVTTEAYSGSILSFLYRYGIDFTALLAIIASLLGFALVHPSKMKIPRWLLLISAWVGGSLFTLFGGISFMMVLFWLLGFIHSLGRTEGMEQWVFILVYGGFFVWGVSVILAALSYQKRTANTNLKPKANKRPKWVDMSGYAAFVWSILFALIHIYWAFGGTALLEGKSMNGVLYVINIIAIFLSVVAAVVALAFLQKWGKDVPSGLFLTAAWIASGLLGLRGGMGIIQNIITTDDIPLLLIIVEPFFLLGGILFGTMAFLYNQNLTNKGDK
jgi:Protein of unknown function (DUF3995)